MERFEFDSKTGPNSNRKNGMTFRGAVALALLVILTARPGQVADAWEWWV